MKIVIVYPLPFDAWNIFLPSVERFTATFKEHVPGADYELWAMCCWGEPTDEVRKMFYGIKTRFVSYSENGEDMGCFQQACLCQPDNAFCVLLTTRCYFHREGWLERMAEAREKFGAGLYGMSANHETWPLHICGRGTAIDSSDFNLYPVALTNKREQGQFFEVGKDNPSGSFLNWGESIGLTARLVMFDGVYEKPDWFKPANRFRNGDQSNVLVWDKHTDLFKDADPAEKARLIQMAEST